VLTYGGTMLVLAVISAWWLARFPITRAEHEARIIRLAERRANADRNAVTAAPDAPFLPPDGMPLPHK
jgi:glycoside/pentoside/hexuronide:cation symporter, GPH family